MDLSLYQGSLTRTHGGRVLYAAAQVHRSGGEILMSSGQRVLVLVRQRQPVGQPQHRAGTRRRGQPGQQPRARATANRQGAHDSGRTRPSLPCRSPGRAHRSPRKARESHQSEKVTQPRLHCAGRLSQPRDRNPGRGSVVSEPENQTFANN